MPIMVATTLPFKGGSCACGPSVADKDYYIATLCACQDCETVPEFCFIGDEVLVGEDYLTFTYEGYIGRRARVVEMFMHEPRDSGFAAVPYDEGEVVPWDVIYVERPYCPLLAIRHLTETAPFAGTLKATVYLNGVELWQDSVGCSQSERIALGYNLEGSNINYPVIELNHQFEEKGCYNLDLLIEFTPSGSEEPYSYVCRKTFDVRNLQGFYNDHPYVGEVVIVNASVDEMECTVHGIIPEQGVEIGLKIVYLRGPFETFDDAYEVLDEWSDFITEYARTCVCYSQCSPEGLCADYVEWDGSRWRLAYSGTGEEAPEEVISGCEDGEISYNVSVDDLLPEGYTVTGEITFRDGSRDSFAFGAGTLPPCSSVAFYIDGPDLDEDWTYDGCVISGSYGPLRTPAKCCVDDSESEYYGRPWEFNLDLCQGVPNSTSDWIAWKTKGCEQYFVRSLLYELPEGMA